jgi:WD40 repeat protein
MLTNQNLLKSIFESFQLVRIQYLINKTINSKLITSTLLNILNYDKVFKSMGRDKTILEHRNPIECLVLLPNGTILAAEYEMLKFWNLDNGKCIGIIEEDVYIRSITLLPEWKFAICLPSCIKIRLAKDDYQCIRYINLEWCSDYFTLLLLENGNVLCSVRKDLSTSFMVLDSAMITYALKSFRHIQNGQPN